MDMGFELLKNFIQKRIFIDILDVFFQNIYLGIVNLFLYDTYMTPAYYEREIVQNFSISPNMILFDYFIWIMMIQSLNLGQLTLMLNWRDFLKLWVF